MKRGWDVMLVDTPLPPAERGGLLAVFAEETEFRWLPDVEVVVGRGGFEVWVEEEEGPEVDAFSRRRRCSRVHLPRKTGW